MGGIATIGKVVLVVLNIATLMIALALTAAGVIIKYFASTALPWVMGGLGTLQEKAKTDFSIPNLEDVKEMPFLDEIGVALIAFGAVLLIISICACCGACCAFRPLLIVFAVVMVVLVIAQAAVGGLFLAKDSPLHDKIQDKIVEKIRSDYKYVPSTNSLTSDSSDVFSMAINLMNYLLECCGMRGLVDFRAGSHPPTCCKREIIDQAQTDPGKAQTCTSGTIPDDPAYVNKEGCYKYLKDLIQNNLKIAAVVLAMLLLIQVVEIIFAILIIKDAGKVGPF